ncbi:immunoglobulin superfamily member 1-like [Chrysemys picta bellii]|uniref:immunoglobulin superfamily member 1-like n=1 Tax=Chrysemys picta bellii TaxID=8478 RepID=UPI0032B134A6
MSRFSKVSFLVGGPQFGGSQAERPQAETPTPSSVLFESPFRYLKAAIKSPLTLLFCSWRTGLGGCPGLVLTACLLCADNSLPRPSISLSPTGVTPLGANVTVRCQGQRQDVRFFLHKAGDLNPQRHMDPAGNGAEFLIPTVGRQHGGNYSCSYRLRSQPFVSSQPSDPVQLVASAVPSRVMALGGNVTIRCESLSPGMEFFLRKAGHPNLQVRTVPDGTVAEFPISTVSWEDGGNYTCDYRSITDQSRLSYLSDPVEIIVAGEGPGSVARLPGPHPARPSGGLCIDGTLRDRLCH